jgi:alkylation response protein AidB-like acyl-CoA dehydrogenase
MSALPTDAATVIENTQESLADFALRARAWIQTNLTPRSGPPSYGEGQREIDRVLQAKIFDAGFAGIAIPRAYGGAGLTLEHQRVWTEESHGYETPGIYMVSIGMMLPTVLDCGTEEVKTRHIPRMLRGEEFWIQLLSEPSGGSDMAGAITRADLRGDAYFVTGSKMWSSGAATADYGLCLVRSNWDVPKHAGLTMVALPLKAKGVTIQPIISVQGGPAHFFTEYLDDVEVPVEYRLGGDGEGWAVAQRLLFHERNATAGVGYGLGLGGGSGSSHGTTKWRVNVGDIARRQGVTHDPMLATRLVGDYIDAFVGEELAKRITTGTATGKLQGQWGSLLKLGMGMECPENADLGLAASGADGVIWSDEGGDDIINNWLKVRGVAIAGGSNEIQRNIVSERLLGLPREPSDDKTTPFGELIRRARSRG